MEKSSFFNSFNGDRRYKAEDWAAYFSAFIGNGVFPLPSTNLQVFAGDGMSVVLRLGKAFINGYYYENTSDLILPLAVADGVLKRIDRIVIRWDLLERRITARVKSSSYSSSPTALVPQRDADAFELCVADVLINNGATSISQAQITDQRLNSNLCGMVAGVVEQIDTTTFNAQLMAWYESVKDMFSEDIVIRISEIANKASEDAAEAKASVIPFGGIIMWSGTVANIPKGWALCNGLNGTPNLQNRFIVGAGSTYAVGNVGGVDSVTLSEAQMPSHTHGTDGQGTHAHTAASAGAHTHGLPSTLPGNIGSDVTQMSQANTHTARRASQTGMINSNYIFSASEGAHTHATDNQGYHGHNISYAGSSSAHENRPPYYALAYIMKL